MWERKMWIRAALAILIVGISCAARAQTQAPPQIPDAHKAVVTRLDGIVQLPADTWRFHTADLSNGQDDCAR